MSHINNPQFVELTEAEAMAVDGGWAQLAGVFLAGVAAGVAANLIYDNYFADDDDSASATAGNNSASASGNDCEAVCECK